MTGNQVYPSKFLKHDDIDEDVTYTIAEVVMEELESRERGKEEKPCIYFKEVEKGLIVNRTNWSLIAKQYGDESDDWIGKQITLTVMDVEAFGDIVSAIRVKPQRKMSTKSTLASKAAPEPTEAADDVTLFWTEAKKLGYERKDALAVLAKCKNDFGAALLALSEEAGL